MGKGNRKSTIRRKLKFLRALKSSEPPEMVREVLEKPWDDKSKAYALKTVEQYSGFIGKPVKAPKIRIYDDREMFVPSPDMVRRLIHRIRDVEVKAQCLIAVETGACESEIHQLTVRDVDFDQRRITIRGVKGHRTWSYPISEVSVKN
ncbi:MAG: tyrosine-type recombinase/integrase [Candidatus Bathyarchaeia archaeon]